VFTAQRTIFTERYEILPICPGCDQVTGDLDRLATQLAGLKRVREQDRRTVAAIVGDSKRGKNAAAAQMLDQAVRADAEAEALALATATDKERII